MARQAVHAASPVCRVLGVSTSGYHAWRKRPPSRRAVEDAALTSRIKEIHAMSDSTHGAPRIRAALADVDGRRVGVRHIARLMRKAGLAVFRHIEGWYNPHRRHSALDCQSPVHHEWKHLAA